MALAPRPLADSRQTGPTFRTSLVQEGLELLRRPPVDGRPNALAVLGPRGAGTSYLAAHILGALDRAGVAETSFPAPRTLRVDLRGIRGGHPVLEALFRGLEPTFNAQGAATEHLTLLWLRRMRSEARPFRIWLDNLQGPCNGLARFLRPLLDPAQILPEGVGGLPPFTVVLSGEGPAGPWQDLPGQPPVLSVPSWTPPELEALARELLSGPGRGDPDPKGVDRLAGLLLTGGRGVSPLPEILSRAHHQARSAGRSELRADDLEPPYQAPWRLRQARSFDALLLDFLRETAGAAPLPLSDLTRGLRGRCANLGIPVPSVARLWRRLRRLEALGLLHRETRVGGPGGTRSLLTIHPLESPSSSSPVSVPDPMTPEAGNPPHGGPLSPERADRSVLLGLGRAQASPRSAGGERTALEGW